MKIRNPFNPNTSLWTIFLTAIAIGVSLTTLLLAYLLPSLLGNSDLQTQILGAATTLAAFAGIVAIINLVSAHVRKLRAKRSPDYYSLFTIIFFLITVVAGILSQGFVQQYFSVITPEDYQKIAVTGIQVPVEASLMALLAVTLTLASFRLFQRRRGLMAVTFLLSALVFLLFNSGVISLLAPILSPGIVNSLMQAVQILPVAGGRGILIGIALGSIMAGLRIVFGAERPYSG